ncbi:unnamed protein product, partial [Chrysoparadoxa australica]
NGERRHVRIGDDSFLDPYLRPASENMSQIVGYAIADVQRTEERQRRRRPKAQKVFEETVSALLCAAAAHHLSGKAGALVTTRANNRLSAESRYKPVIYSAQYRHILDHLAAPGAGWIEQTIGFRTSASNAPATTIKASERLKVYMRERQVTRADIKRVRGGEPIILKSSADDATRDKGLVDYEDTEVTRAYREEVDTINVFLAEADIEAWGAEGVDDRERTLRRVFNNGSFEQGGRLFGGFWEAMGKDARLQSIEIDQEPVVELDYGQMSARVIYGLASEPVTFEDAYLLNRFPEPLRSHIRTAVKKVFNSMLNRTTQLNRYPEGVRDMVDKHLTDTDRPVSAGVMREAILKQHPAIADWFESGQGLKLMFRESEILIDVLLALNAEGIVALPIHDAILVGSSHEVRAKAVMEGVFRDHVGGEPLVDVTRGDG